MEPSLISSTRALRDWCERATTTIDAGSSHNIMEKGNLWRISLRAPFALASPATVVNGGFSSSRSWSVCSKAAMNRSPKPSCSRSYQTAASWNSRAASLPSFTGFIRLVFAAVPVQVHAPAQESGKGWLLFH